MSFLSVGKLGLRGGRIKVRGMEEVSSAIKDVVIVSFMRRS